MFEYQVEVIHEPSGKYINFTVFTDDKQDIDSLSNEVIGDLSVVIFEGEAQND